MDRVHPPHAFWLTTARKLSCLPPFTTLVTRRICKQSRAGSSNIVVPPQRFKRHSQATSSNLLPQASALCSSLARRAPGSGHPARTAAPHPLHCRHQGISRSAAIIVRLAARVRRRPPRPGHARPPGKRPCSRPNHAHFAHKAHPQRQRGPPPTGGPPHAARPSDTPPGRAARR